MRAASALLLMLACWAGAAETRIALNTAHPLYSKVVAVWPFAATGTDSVNAVVASPIDSAYDGVAGVLPLRVADMRGTLGYVSSFTGTEYLKCGGVGNFEHTDPFSVFVIIKKPDVAAAATICGKYTDANVGWRILLNTNQTIQFRLANGGNTIRVQSPATMIDRYFSFCFTYDGSSLASGMKYYENGGAIGVTVVTAGPMTASALTAEEFGIGAQNVTETASAFVIGSIPYLAVFNAALTPAEVAMISLNYRDMLVLDKPNSTRYMRYLINNGIFNGR